MLLQLFYTRLLASWNHRSEEDRNESPLRMQDENAFAFESQIALLSSSTRFTILARSVRVTPVERTSGTEKLATVLRI